MTETGLPPEIQSLYYSPEMLAAVQAAGAKYKLHIDQIGILEQEVAAVMVGSVEPKDFPEDLMHHLGVDRVTADGLIQDLNDSLFIKIRDAMRKRSEGENTAPTLQPQPLERKNDPLKSVSVSTEKVVDTSIAPRRESGYRTDPYREPAE